MYEKLKQDAEAFGADFRARRRAAGLTPSEVAASMARTSGKLGVHTSYVNGLERGEFPRMKASTKRRLNEALERAIDNEYGRRAAYNAFVPYPIDTFHERELRLVVARERKKSLFAAVSLAIGTVGGLIFAYIVITKGV